MIKSKQFIYQVFTLPSYGLLKIVGQDAKRFLQGQLSNDLELLNNHTSQLTGYCNIQGRVTSLGIIWQHAENSFYLLLPKDICTETLTELNRYRLRAKVNCIDATSTHTCLGLSLTNDLPKPTELPEQINCIEHPCLPNIYFITAETEFMNSYFVGNKPIHPYLNSVNYKISALKHGLVDLNKTTANAYLAHDLDLIKLGAASLTKGCYRGQEIIARLQHRGKPKRGLYFLQIPWAFPADINYNQEIKLADNQKTIGHLVDFIIYQQTLTGLAVCQHQFADRMVKIAESNMFRLHYLLDA